MLSRRIHVVAVALAVLALPVAARAQDKSYYCVAGIGLPAARTAIGYITRVTPMTAEYGDITAAWKVYASEHYGDRVITSECYMGAPAMIEKQHETAGYNYRNGKIIESDWEYSTSMTALPSKTGAVYAFCFSGEYGGKTVYETPTFEIPVEDAASVNSPVEVTFVHYLEKHYPKKTSQRYWQSYSLGCPHSAGNRATTEAQRLKAEKTYIAQGNKLVQTNWVYARTPETPPAGTPRRSH